MFWNQIIVMAARPVNVLKAGVVFTGKMLNLTFCEFHPNKENRE